MKIHFQGAFQTEAEAHAAACHIFAEGGTVIQFQPDAGWCVFAIF